ncbi:MAG TPA: hypothetical protein VGR28_08200 [Candidatus Thermoplasmatota archaeon]|jgi:hypothetical protein|nr:hypothetical protein [Candidatus Thermoplasmatota archaeon]
MTVRVVVTARGGANLKRAIVEAARSGALRTFEAYDRGRKLRHRQRATHPGYIVLHWRAPDLIAEVRGDEASQLLGSFVARLHARFGEQIESVHLRFA